MLTTFKGPDSAKQKYTKTQLNELCFTLGHKPSKERDYLIIRYFITCKYASWQCRSVKSQWKTTWSAIQVKNDNVKWHKRVISYSGQDSMWGFKLKRDSKKAKWKWGGGMTGETTCIYIAWYASSTQIVAYICWYNVYSAGQKESQSLWQKMYLTILWCLK